MPSTSLSFAAKSGLVNAMSSDSSLQVLVAHYRRACKTCRDFNKPYSISMLDKFCEHALKRIIAIALFETVRC